VATEPRDVQLPPGEGKARPTHRTRLAAAGVLGALAIAFALVNTKEVEVNWILGSWSTPLIIVIAVSFLVGVAADRLSVVRRSRRRSGD
jgi:uncharacterized integral membrane protein